MTVGTFLKPKVLPFFLCKCCSISASYFTYKYIEHFYEDSILSSWFNDKPNRSNVRVRTCSRYDGVPAMLKSGCRCDSLQLLTIWDGSIKVNILYIYTSILVTWSILSHRNESINARVGRLSALCNGLSWWMMVKPSVDATALEV